LQSDRAGLAFGELYASSFNRQAFKRNAVLLLAQSEGYRKLMSQRSHAVASPRVVNIEDLRLLAKRRLPKAVFDYLDGGAEDEVTLRENCQAFSDFTFRPRQAVKFPEYNLRTTVLGTEISFPAFLAPV
jgi:hypothetical protein